MRFYSCTNHDTFCPVGAASVIVAANKGHAKRLLDKALKDKNLKPSIEEPYDLVEIDITKSQAVILWDGNY